MQKGDIKIKLPFYNFRYVYYDITKSGLGALENLIPKILSIYATGYNFKFNCRGWHSNSFLFKTQ